MFLPRLLWLVTQSTSPIGVVISLQSRRTPDVSSGLTGSPVVFDGVVYVGVSSSEETLAANPAYPCCSFRGSVVALDAKNGQMLWKTFDMPDNGGRTNQYSGGAVWQPPAIDPERGTLFIGTGNNYTAPADVVACQNTNPNADCTAPDDFF